MTNTTISTPVGPFTIVARGRTVLASGFTDDVDELVASIHPTLRDDADADADLDGIVDRGSRPTSTATSPRSTRSRSSSTPAASSSTTPGRRSARSRRALRSPTRPWRLRPAAGRDPCARPRPVRATRPRCSCRATASSAPTAASAVTAGASTSSGGCSHMNRAASTETTRRSMTSRQHEGSATFEKLVRDQSSRPDNVNLCRLNPSTAR